MARASLREVAALFLRMGFTAFGGPAAHVALLEDEVVRKRGWVSREEFLDLFSASNIIPGPNSTELAIHLGYRRAGWAGLVVAGVCFIVPAVIIVWVLAWGYVRVGARVEVNAMLQTMQPVVLAVVVQAIWRLGRGALRTRSAWVIAAASVVAMVMGVHELVVLAAAALVALVVHGVAGRWEGVAMSFVMVPTEAGLGSTGAVGASAGVAAGVAASVAASVSAGVAAGASSGAIFLSFARIGSVLFGSGYVLLAFLRREFVERNAWLTDAQLLDAIIIGQVTPGPVFTTATFVGYLLQGNSGAIAATIGIFLPAFVFVAATARLVRRLREWRAGAALLVGLNAASLALMASVVIVLAESTVRSSWSVMVLVVAFVALVSGRAGAGVLLLLAAALGLVRQVVG